MTGPEHYQEAERLLAAATDNGGDPTPGECDDAYRAAAQVHATLALASAQALAPVTHFMGDDPLVTEWGRLLGHDKVAPAVLS